MEAKTSAAWDQKKGDFAESERSWECSPTSDIAITSFQPCLAHRKFGNTRYSQVYGACQHASRTRPTQSATISLQKRCLGQIRPVDLCENSSYGVRPDAFIHIPNGSPFSTSIRIARWSRFVRSNERHTRRFIQDHDKGNGHSNERPLCKSKTNNAPQA